ncbi:NifB/NifX family molybdenum-iron cluster-binding protein [Candidatus Xianfuyuplasma coldseepsis]|uniref:Dinitrogenase iron-molybdenum cofactor biosynthesis domain-containing protein n=1 Tax=Candidatus Xianfuyuplasma coldseepsis TaxID=2782163 RepID=A0A7L7KSX5_9MOLU|nr:NifB/NifX family molybdenum-iron cluster-binding protein [Xianfuyuplasma coldseepsis]QMS85807.1 hypothetical protein G4Z02_08630 [Xianfuyuplasma coldseepsis]
MRIAIPTEGNTKEAPVSPHFGRCDYYCIYDSEELSFRFIENPYVKENAAGNKAAKLLLEQCVDFVIASDIGNKAQKTLHSYKIRTYSSKSDKPLIDQVYSFLEKDLTVLEQGTKESKHNHTHHEH